MNISRFPPKGSNVQPFTSSKIRLMVELNQLSQLNKTSGVVPMFFHKRNPQNADVIIFRNIIFVILPIFCVLGIKVCNPDAESS
jgi:hypothetical protein